MSEKIRISEMFLSLQGEGLYTGKNTAWVRMFNCNLTCSGFFQKDPTRPETYVLPYEELDISRISMVEELPVFETGCDSSYSWAKKYKHLIPLYTETEIAVDLKPQARYVRGVVTVQFNGGTGPYAIVDAHGILGSAKTYPV